jgi:hypothetical protein
VLWIDLVVVAGTVDYPHDGTHDGQGDGNADPNLELATSGLTLRSQH